MRHLTEAEELQFRKWWRDGLILDRIAERMQCEFGWTITASGVSRIALRLGLRTRKERWTPEQNARFKALWMDKTIPAAEIAKTLSKEMGRPISENAVTVHAHKLGLPSRRMMKWQTGR